MSNPKSAVEHVKCRLYSMQTTMIAFLRFEDDGLIQECQHFSVRFIADSLITRGIISPETLRLVIMVARITHSIERPKYRKYPNIKSSGWCPWHKNVGCLTSVMLKCAAKRVQLCCSHMRTREVLNDVASNVWWKSNFIQHYHDNIMQRHYARWWPNKFNMLHSTMLNDVESWCCIRLARA